MKHDVKNEFWYHRSDYKECCILMCDFMLFGRRCSLCSPRIIHGICW